MGRERHLDGQLSLQDRVSGLPLGAWLLLSVVVVVVVVVRGRSLLQQGMERRFREERGALRRGGDERFLIVGADIAVRSIG